MALQVPLSGIGESVLAKEKAACLLKKRGSVSSISSHEVRAKETVGKTKDSISTVSYIDEPGHYEICLLCRWRIPISLVIKARVKELMIPRYKIIVQINIGQLSAQNMRSGSRCLWDPVNDTFSSHAFKNSSLFAVASVY
ncbi:hypothetical protein JZ751_014089, partial [Albula glossodonta]